MEISEDVLYQDDAKRKLASIQLITNLFPIEGADKIECAIIQGWYIVVQKGLYNIGDKVIFFEIDSILPKEYFPELEKCKYRIKTCKLRGQLSQGYVIPLSIAEEIVNKINPNCDISYEENSNWTSILQVNKYIAATNDKIILGEIKGVFPSYLINKTDEERLQSNCKYLGLFHGKPYEITIKCDGSSCTLGYDNEFFIASRNMKVSLENNTFAYATSKYNFKLLYEQNEHLQNYILQGEIVGPKIQGNKLELESLDFLVFNIFDKQTKKMLNYEDRKVLSDMYGFKLVPLIKRGSNFNYTLQNLVDMSKGYYINTKNHREGIVVRTYNVPMVYGNYLSFKVINNDYLLGEK